MAGSHVAAGLGEDRHDVGSEAHRPLGRHDRSGAGRRSKESERNDGQDGGEEPAPDPGGRRGAGRRRPVGKGWGHGSRVPSVGCHGVFLGDGPACRTGKARSGRYSPLKSYLFLGGGSTWSAPPSGAHPHPSTMGIRIVECDSRKVRCFCKRGISPRLRGSAPTSSTPGNDHRQTDGKEAPLTLTVWA